MEKPRVYRKTSMLTVQEVCKRMSCSRRHVYNLIERGELPAFRYGGIRGLRVPETGVEEFITQRMVDPGV
jgi:excisionase family DNA binding protein